MPLIVFICRDVSHKMTSMNSFGSDVGVSGAVVFVTFMIFGNWSAMHLSAQWSFLFHLCEVGLQKCHCLEFKRGVSLELKSLDTTCQCFLQNNSFLNHYLLVIGLWSPIHHHHRCLLLQGGWLRNFLICQLRLNLNAALLNSL